MRALLLIALLPLLAYAAPKDAPVTKDHNAECQAAADKKAGKAKAKSPMEVVDIKNREFERCLRKKGYSAGAVRNK